MRSAQLICSYAVIIKVVLLSHSKLLILIYKTLFIYLELVFVFLLKTMSNCSGWNVYPTI